MNPPRTSSLTTITEQFQTQPNISNWIGLPKAQKTTATQNPTKVRSKSMWVISTPQSLNINYFSSSNKSILQSSTPRSSPIPSPKYQRDMGLSSSTTRNKPKKPSLKWTVRSWWANLSKYRPHISKPKKRPRSKARKVKVNCFWDKSCTLSFTRPSTTPKSKQSTRSKFWRHSATRKSSDRPWSKV